MIKIKKNFSLVLAFVNNFLFFILILKRVLKKRNIAFNLAIFFSIIAYYYTAFNEYSDVYRYLYYPEAVLKKSKDLYVIIFLKYLFVNKYPINYLLVISAFIMYYFFFKSFETIIDKNKYSTKYYLLFYFIFYFMLPPFGYTGIRFYPATAIFTYSMILKITNKNKKFYFYSFLAGLIHIFYIFPFILVILEKFSKKIIKYQIIEKLFFILLIISFCGIGEEIIKSIYMLLKSININIPDAYLYGRWGIEYYQNLNFGGKVVYILTRIYISLWIYLYFKIKLSGVKKENQTIILYLGVICLLSSSFRTIHERIFFSIYYPTFLILLSNQDRRNRKLKIILIVLSVFYGILQIAILLKSYLPEIVYLLKNFWKMSILDIII